MHAVTLAFEVTQLVCVVSGKERGQPFNGILELWMLIDEGAHPGREPLDAELFTAAPVLEFLNAAVGEVHVRLLLPRSVSGAKRYATGAPAPDTLDIRAGHAGWG